MHQLTHPSAAQAAQRRISERRQQIHTRNLDRIRQVAAAARKG